MAKNENRAVINWRVARGETVYDVAKALGLTRSSVFRLLHTGNRAVVRKRELALVIAIVEAHGPVAASNVFDLLASQNTPVPTIRVGELLAQALAAGQVVDVSAGQHPVWVVPGREHALQPSGATGRGVRMTRPVADEVNRRYAAGQNGHEIAAALGISTGTVFNHLRGPARAGGPPRTLSPPEIATAVALREQGWSLRRIAAQLGVSATLIFKRVPHRPQVDPVPPDRAREWDRLYTEGCSANQIAARYGVPAARVLGHLSVPVRPGVDGLESRDDQVMEQVIDVIADQEPVSTTTIQKLLRRQGFTASHHVVRRTCQSAEALGLIVDIGDRTTRWILG